eukprot:191606-Heterocapsa_arctica.AAC.1
MVIARMPGDRSKTFKNSQKPSKYSRKINCSIIHRTVQYSIVVRQQGLRLDRGEAPAGPGRPAGHPGSQAAFN